MRTAARAPLRVPESWLAEEHSKVGPFVTREVYRVADGTRHEWSSRRHRKGHERLTEHTVFWQPRTLGWWIAVLFAIGSFLFALAATVVCFAWKSVTDWGSLSRVLVAATAAFLFALVAEVLGNKVLEPKCGRAARRKPTTKRR